MSQAVAQYFTHIVSNPCNNIARGLIHILQVNKCIEVGIHPRFTQLRNCGARIQAQFIIKALAFSSPLGWELRSHVLERRGEETLQKLWGIPFWSRSLLSLDQNAKHLGRVFFGPRLPLFSILMLSMVYSPGQKLGRECAHGLLEILKRHTSAHTHDFTPAM